MGGGTKTCAEYVETVQRYGENARQTFFMWAQGFMAGLNTPVMLLFSGQTTNLQGRTTEWQIDAIDSYCADHPQKEYMFGALAVFNQMRAEQKLRTWQTTLGITQHQIGDGE